MSLTAACGDGPDEAGQSDASNPDGRRKPILIRTRVILFKGEVLPGSVVGDDPFCPGGTVRHTDGSPEIGFPAVNVFRCADGQLRIGFGPGPDQMEQAVQTSPWEILDGTGRFAGARGDGQMKVRFERAGGTRGRETFKGTVVLP